MIDCSSRVARSRDHMPPPRTKKMLAPPGAIRGENGWIGGASGNCRSSPSGEGGSKSCAWAVREEVKTMVFWSGGKGRWRERLGWLMEGWEVSWWTRAPVRESRLAECSEGETCPLWEIMGASIRYPKHYATVSDLLSQGIAATPFPAGAAGAGSTQAQSEGLRSR